MSAYVCTYTWMYTHIHIHKTIHVHVCVYMYIYSFVRIHVSTYTIYMNSDICIYVYLRIHIHIHIHMIARVSVCIYMHVCTYICMYVCIFWFRKCMHTYVHAQLQEIVHIQVGFDLPYVMERISQIWNGWTLTSRSKGKTVAWVRRDLEMMHQPGSNACAWVNGGAALRFQKGLCSTANSTRD